MSNTAASPNHTCGSTITKLRTRVSSVSKESTSESTNQERETQTHRKQETAPERERGTVDQWGESTRIGDVAKRFFKIPPKPPDFNSLVIPILISLSFLSLSLSRPFPFTPHNASPSLSTLYSITLSLDRASLSRGNSLTRWR